MKVYLPHDVYVIAMAALLESDAHAARGGQANNQYIYARRSLKAAMLTAITAELEVVEASSCQPALLRRQAE